MKARVRLAVGLNGSMALARVGRTRRRSSSAAGHAPGRTRSIGCRRRGPRRYCHSVDASNNIDSVYPQSHIRAGRGAGVMTLLCSYRLQRRFVAESGIEFDPAAPRQRRDNGFTWKLRSPGRRGVGTEHCKPCLLRLCQNYRGSGGVGGAFARAHRDSGSVRSTCALSVQGCWSCCRTTQRWSPSRHSSLAPLRDYPGGSEASTPSGPPRRGRHCHHIRCRR
jgi:hypothetical protein